MASTLGPERSVEFPVPASLKNLDQPLVSLYFTDARGKSWKLDEDGKISQRKYPVSEHLLGKAASGRKAPVVDHSGASGPNGKEIELGDAPVIRMDMDPMDGNSFSMILTPEGMSVEYKAMVEAKDDNGGRMARGQIDAEGHLIELTVCNLPPDSHLYAYPEYLQTENSFVVFFGKKEETIKELMTAERAGSSWIFGQKNLSWGELARIAYDKQDHLLFVEVPIEHLVPGFLPED